MHFFSKLSLLLAATLTAVGGSSSHLNRGIGGSGHNRRDLIRRQSGDLVKRYDGARMTWFVDGLGACGWTNGPDDPIIALSIPMFAGGIHCGKSLTITYQGKSVQATVADECQDCDYTAIDLSHGLFAQFASPEIVGTIYGTWNFNDGSGGGGGGGGDSSSSQKTTSTSTSQYTPPPTSTSTSKKTSSTTSSTTSSSTSTTSSTTHSTTTSTTKTSTSTTSTSTTSTTSSTATPTPTSQFGQLNSAYLSVIQVVVNQ